MTYSQQRFNIKIMDIKKQFGEKIKKLRKENNNMTQEYLEEISGIDRSYISSVERGKRNISIVNIEKLAKAFNIKLSELFEF